MNYKSFVFFTMASTKDGKSVMEHTKRNSETDFKHWFSYYGVNASVTNLITFDTYYETLETIWGSAYDNMAKFKDCAS